MGLIDGGLFTRGFLNEGILATPQWAALDAAAVAEAAEIIAAKFASLAGMKNLTEAVTEKSLIYPLLPVNGFGGLFLSSPTAPPRCNIKTVGAVQNLTQPPS